MASGIFALLDDVAAIAKVAAASIDDTAAAAAKAGAKAAGVVIDDAAVTPRYVTGFAAAREIPIVAKIARGSIINKLVFLLPGLLALSAFAPWAVTPLLMAGGAFLCFEGAEKLWEKMSGHEKDTAADTLQASDPEAYEKQMVSGAIRTDLILSAEIMAITLATVATEPLWEQAMVLAIVGVVITVAVYGAVALIVKADDAGVWLTRNAGTSAGKAVGRGLVTGMPKFLKALSWVGTLAMLWVGGGIIIHGLAGYAGVASEYGIAGLDWPEHLLHDWAAAVGGGLPGWLVTALGGLVTGVVVGAIIVAALHLLPARKAQA